MTDTVSIQNGNLISTSEKVLGLVLEGKQSATFFDPDKMFGEYAKMLREYKAGKTKEDLVSKYGTTAIQSAIHAARSVNGLGTELDWKEILDKAYRNTVLTDDLNKAIRAIENGDPDKLGDILRRANATFNSSLRSRSITADEISDEYVPFMESGSPAWDEHIGGFPTIGTVILGAKTYTGKTTVAICLMDFFLKQYPEKEILFVTLEDMNEGWKHRAKILLGDRDASFWKRIRVMEFATNPDDVITEVSRHENVGLIMVDYIDYLASSKDLASYEEIHKTFSMGSKSLAVNSKFRSMPIFLLAQFGKTLYKGGVPTLDALPYAGDTYAYQICMLYHPDGDFYSDNVDNPYTLMAGKNEGFLVFWKVKGARPHDDEFPGAIKVPWSGRMGFNIGVKGEWQSLASETKRAVQKKGR